MSPSFIHARRAPALLLSSAATATSSLGLALGDLLFNLVGDTQAHTLTHIAR